MRRILGTLVALGALVPVGLVSTPQVQAAGCFRCQPPPHPKPPPADKPISLSLAPRQVANPSAAAGNWDLGTLTDGDATPPGGASGYIVVIDWGDGTVSSGSALLKYAWYMNVPNVFEIYGNHTYAATGQYSATVQVSDAGQSVTSASAVSA